jgi:hypothetical protein
MRVHEIRLGFLGEDGQNLPDAQRGTLYAKLIDVSTRVKPESNPLDRGRCRAS